MYQAFERKTMVAIPSEIANEEKKKEHKSNYEPHKIGGTSFVNTTDSSRHS